FDGTPGYFSAERPGTSSLHLPPQMFSREGYRDAAVLFPPRGGRIRANTANNARKLLEWRELLQQALPPSFARSLLTAAKDSSLETLLQYFTTRASDATKGEQLATHLRSLLGQEPPVSPSHTFAQTQTRTFEEELWRLMAFLSEEELRE